MRPLIRAVLVAPAPAFVLLATVALGPVYGLQDIALSVGVAFTVTYGLLITAGLPTHWILRYFSWSSFESYVLGFMFAVIVVIAVATISEGSPPPPLSNDNSLFAELTLKGGGWLIAFLISAPLVAVTAALFWKVAIADPAEA